MRPTSSLRFLAKRLLSAFIAFGMAFGPVTAAYANPTPLADIPIASKVTAKPNIIYTLDDSGSMQYNYLPDYVVSAAANIAISPANSLKKVGTNVQFTVAAGNFPLLSVGDWVLIQGAAPPEYNGSFQIVAKSPTVPTANSFQVTPSVLPATTPATGAPVIITSTPYCRSGNSVTPCVAQAMNIASTGTVVAFGGPLKRAGPIGVGPNDTVTATGTAAQFATLSTGDTVLIMTSSTVIFPTGGTASSAPFYGAFTINKTSPTTFTYVITNAVPGVTPVTSGGGRNFVIQGGSAFAAPPLHAADFNRLAYNPAVTYYAPKKADGLPLTNTGTDGNGNYGASLLQWASPSVDRDPYAAYEVAAHPTIPPMWASTVKDDLSIKIAVPLYCNTDWPLLVSDPTWVSGGGGATALDAGDSNGQYQSGKGEWCRINGTKYDLINGSPAAVADYNYPWQPTGNLSTNFGKQFFWQTLSTKRIWCDKTSPYWPRTKGAIIGCTLGGTPTGGSSVPQVCTQTGSPNVCSGSWPTLQYKDTATGTQFCDNSTTWCSARCNRPLP